MERLRISDLSFCEDEVSDLSQVQGGFESGFVSSLSTAINSKFESGYYVDKNGKIVPKIEASTSGAAAGAVAGGIAAGGKLVLYSSTFATAS
ncbi:hypothetical protein [Nostoc sp. LPT]|uniref:hypothetical protein n=1 Tax=Nostoc sp. LPT TaxID=2815387 RepID=UPI001D9C2284|nr:hypothetical protein [Nostoc sp. LPT]MBN4006011.1 hypothetical protein [Nostoc sp. LPT]